MDRRFPIGKFIMPIEPDQNMINKALSDIETLPTRIIQTLDKMSNVLIDTVYRPGGWTGRQVVHHIADSHCQGFTRVKLALTENVPIVKPYEENEWAHLADSRQLPLEPSLKILEGTHKRWTYVLRSLNGSDLEKCYFHPGQDRKVTIKESIFSYAWHGNHHLAHLLLILDKP